MPTVERRVVRLVKGEWKALTIGLLCTVGVAGVEFAIAKLIQYFVDLATHKDLAGLDRLMAVVFLVAACRYFLTSGQLYYMVLAGQNMSRKLRQQIFRHMQHLPLSFFQSKQSGALQSTITIDVNLVENSTKLARDLISEPVKVIGGLIYIFVLNWRLASVALLAMPFMLYVIIRRGRKIRRITQDLQDRYGSFVSVLEEALRGIRIIKAFGMEKYEIARFEEQNNAAFRTSMHVQKKIASIKPLVELLGTVGIAAVLWIGGRDVARGAMSGGELMGFLYVVHMMVTAASGVGQMNATRSQVLAAAERIYREVLDVVSDLTDKPDAPPLPPLVGHIEFRNVTFRYPDGTEALSDVSFTIQPGESIAVVGESGAGKSTMADLLLRFYDPIAGQVLIDGFDLRDVTQGSIRNQIGVVPQTTLLFSGSIRENIRYGKPDATEEEIDAAVSAAHLTRFVERREDGLDSALGGRADGLSGGEGQRVAIARALIRKPAILLLDEATSALDSVSERSVQEAVEENKNQRTVVLIAHRLSTAARADRVLVFHRGRLVEQGTHTELLALDGEYTRLYRAYSHGIVDMAVS